MGLLGKVKSFLAVDTSNAANSKDGAMELTALLAKAGQLADLGNTDAALECYRQVLEIEPTCAAANFHRGVIFLDSGNAQLALDEFGWALATKPKSAGTHYNMGNAHLAMGNFDAAVEAYKTAISIQPSFHDASAALQTANDQRNDHAEHLFRQAVASQEHSDLVEAQRLYRVVLDLTPNRAEAWSNLGGVLFLEEKPEEAKVHFEHAVNCLPCNADIRANLGNVYKFLNQLDSARLCYEKSTQLDPKNPAHWLQLGQLQSELGLYKDALTSISRSIDLDGSVCEAHLAKCVALIATEDYASAEVFCLRAIQIEPQNAVAFCNLGVVLRRRGKLAEAVDQLKRAIALKPNFFEAHLNLGTVLMALGNFEAALTEYQKTLAINAQSAEAHSNYGALLFRLERYAEAEQSLLRSISINPNLATARNNLGLVLGATRRMPEAVKAFEIAIELKPEYVDAYVNLGGVLKDMGRIDESLQALRRALTIDPDCLIAHSNLLFINNYVADQPADSLLFAARRYGEAVLRLATPFDEWRNSREPGRTLRIGLVSGDLCSHPVGYFLEGVLTALRATESLQLELYAYATRQNDDATSQKLRAHCESWQCVFGLSDEDFARTVHDTDLIDILIDLSGHTANNRLSVFGWRPAPIQVSWLGYFATTGVEAMDYFLADHWTLPVEQEVNFTEQVWRLPETRLCFSAPNVPIEVNTLPALSQGYVTFGSFNNLSKVNDEVVRVWAIILTAVPSSRLFLKYQQLGDATMRQKTTERFAVHGVAADRLIFEDYGPRADYLAAYHRVDIGLDPFPFPGGTTTAESLWMGVPVLTLSGERFIARQGVGLMMNAGLSDWVAIDVEDYVKRAVAHATHLQELSTLRRGLRQIALASPIFDAERFANNFGAALRSMWLHWCKQSKSAAVTIEGV
jgi:predicted O-linked N-acetylglucosamine transferase (SPINDLY family)